MRRIIICLVVFLLSGIYSYPVKASQNDWCFDRFDHEVLRSLHQELLALNGYVNFQKEIEVKASKANGLRLVFENKGQDNFRIVGVSFNGLSVLGQSKIKHWRKNGQEYVEVEFNKREQVREGLNYFLTKYQWHSNTCATVLIWVEKGKRERKHKRLIVEQRALKALGKLHNTQQKLESFSADLSAHFEDYRLTDPPIAKLDFEGKFRALGWDKFPLTLSTAPTYTIERGGKSYISQDPEWKKKFPATMVVGRNHLGPYNLIFYLDYYNLIDNYNWEVIFETKEKIGLRGFAQELKQQPYQYLLEIDKKHWLPLTVQTFLDRETVVSWANADYKKVDRLYVPVKQVTTAKFKDTTVQEYSLDINQKIKVNQLPLKKSNSI